MLSQYLADATPDNPAERVILVSSPRGWLGELPPLVFCHGSGVNTSNYWFSAATVRLIRALARHYVVSVPDLFFQLGWGNDAHASRIEDAREHIETHTGATGPVTLVAGSMGNLGAMQYARQHPDNVTAIASVVPAVDLADGLLRGFAADINAAYGGTYDDAVDGPDHSPVQYAADLDPDLPIHLFTVSDDIYTVPATQDAFVAARPQTERTNLGALGHDEDALAAAVNPIVAWLARVRLGVA